MDIKWLSEDERELLEWLPANLFAVKQRDAATAALNSLAAERERNAELVGTLPGRMMGCQAVADEKCKQFLARAEIAEKRNRELVEALEEAERYLFNNGVHLAADKARAALARNGGKP